MEKGVLTIPPEAEKAGRIRDEPRRVPLRRDGWARDALQKWGDEVDRILAGRPQLPEREASVDDAILGRIR